MPAGKRNCNTPPTPDHNMWLCGPYTDLSVMCVRVGVANFIWVNR